MPAAKNVEAGTITAACGVIEARLLAKQSFETIADAASTRPEVIEWYEAIFFNVADRLRNRDWVTTQILLPTALKHMSQSQVAARHNQGDAVPIYTPQIARPFLDFSLKLYAYFGGAHLVDFMITGFQAGKQLNSMDDLTRWLDDDFSVTIKRRSAQAAKQFEVNKFNVIDLFSVNTRIMEMERSEESEQRARSTIERHVRTLMDEIPWMHGDAAEKYYGETPLAAFDDKAAEPREDELLRIVAGRGDNVDAEIVTLEMPPPRQEN